MIFRQHGYGEHAGKVSGQNSKRTCRIGVAVPLPVQSVTRGHTHFPLVNRPHGKGHNFFNVEDKALDPI